MSFSVTSTVPPSDSRNAVSAQTSERFSAIGGLSTAGMIGGYPSTMKAPGLISDSSRYAFALIPGLALAARAPTPARSGARVPFWPIRWQISQVPLVL